MSPSNPDPHERLRTAIADIAVTLLQACAHIPVPQPCADDHDMNCPTCRLMHAAWSLADMWSELGNLERELLRHVDWFIAEAIEHAEGRGHCHWREVIETGEQALEALSELSGLP